MPNKRQFAYNNVICVLLYLQVVYIGLTAAFKQALEF